MNLICVHVYRCILSPEGRKPQIWPYYRVNVLRWRHLVIQRQSWTHLHSYKSVQRYQQPFLNSNGLIKVDIVRPLAQTLPFRNVTDRQTKNYGTFSTPSTGDEVTVPFLCLPVTMFFVSDSVYSFAVMLRAPKFFLERHRKQNPGKGMRTV